MDAMDQAATYLLLGPDGAVYGPADVAGLQAWTREGRVLPDTWLREPHTGRLLRAADLPGLSAFWIAPVLAAPVFGAPVFGAPVLAAPGPPLALPAVAAGICGNCHRPAPAGVRFCPSCGFGGGMGLAELPPRLLTGSSAGDVALGLLPTLALLVGPALWTLAMSGVGGLFGPLSWLAFGLLVLAAVRQAFAAYPRVKRGMGIGLLLSLLTMLALGTVGAVAFVTSVLSTPFKPCGF